MKPRTQALPIASIAPAAIALIVGVLAFAAPPAALLALAALAANAIIASRFTKASWGAFAGPLLAIGIVGAFAGLAGAVGTLFVWRLFADTRWGVLEAARLAHAAGRPAEAGWRALGHAWLTPFYGLTLVAYTAPHMVAGLPLDLPHAPAWVPLIAGIAAAAAVFDWALQRAADWRLGELAPAPAVHLLTHHVVFLAAFGAMLDVSAGIFALAAWRLAHAAPARAPQLSFTAVP